ncbi:ankyrin [Xylariaceae sp. FL1651]|nr:ankyrin [Xylariaceae sp. FL1651]
MAQITPTEPGAKRVGNIHPAGITELYVPSSPIVDICFVHGFTGHPDRTWRSKKRAKKTEISSNHVAKRAKLASFMTHSRLAEENTNNPDVISEMSDTSELSESVYWPRDLLPEIIPQARVLTFGYDTNIRHSLGGPISQNRLSDHAGDFLAALEGCRHRNPCRPLVFIAHSLGGLLVKDMLRISKSYESSQPDRWRVYESTASLLFFGTPHAGADPRNALHRTLTNIIKALGFRVNNEIVQTLMPGAERSKLLADDFLKWTSACGWDIYTFQEELPHSALKVKIVEDHSSCINDPCHERIVHIRADHVDMCRFTDIEDPEFRKVTSALFRVQESLISRPLRFPSDATPPLEHPQSRTDVLPLSPEQRQRLLEKLSFEGIDSRYMTHRTAHSKTCQWLPQHSLYKLWLDPAQLDTHHGFLWIRGKPGTGKSVMMKYLFQSTRRNKRNCIVISFFFSARGSLLEHTTEGMYRSLLSQLLPHLPMVNIDQDALHHLLNLDENKEWPIEALKDVLRSFVEQIKKDLYCFVDALDECPEDEVRDMISFLEDLGTNTTNSNFKVRVCFSSRHYPYITIRYGLQLVLEDEVDHSKDMQCYIRSKLNIKQPRLRQEIEDEIVERSSRIFLWAVLVVDILNKEYDKGGDVNIRKKLRQLPKGLHQLFHDILTRDNGNLDELVLCIQWILYAKRPLRPEELYFGMKLGGDPSACPLWDQTAITLDQISRFNLNVSKGLAEVTKKDKTVQFIHESVRDYLLREKGLQTLLHHLDSPTSLSEGASHDTLRDICSTQIFATVSIGKTPDNEDQQSWMPLLKYAITYILVHADSAQSSGSDQKEFLSNFPREAWIDLDNELQKHKTRRHSDQVHLLYLLAEQNLASLIGVHPERHRALFMQQESERYPSPVIAAMAFGQNEAIRAIALEAARGVVSRDRHQDLSRIEAELRNMPRFRKDLDGSHWKRTSTFSAIGAIGSASLVDIFWDQILAVTDMKTEEILANLQLSTSPEVAKLLIQRGALVDGICNVVDGAALQISVKADTVATAEYLLSLGANPNLESAMISYNCFSQAKSSRMAELLLQYGAFFDRHLSDLGRVGKFILSLGISFLELPDPTKRLWAQAKQEFSGQSMLHMAADGGTPLSFTIEASNVAMVRILLDSGANPNLQAADGCTPLYLAAKASNVAVVRILLDSGANPNLQAADGCTPLYLAAKASNVAVVRILLDSGANPNLQVADGCTPLLAAALALEYNYKGAPAQRTVELILQSTMLDTVNVRNRVGRSPLCSAMEAGNCEVSQWLISHPSFDANSEVYNAYFPICRAVQKAQFEVAQQLLSHPSININLRDKLGISPLCRAVHRNSLETVQLLLSYPTINVNLQDNNGSSPLIWAVSYDYLEIVQLLISHPTIDVNFQDEKGRTPLLLAARSAELETVQLLLSDSRVDRGARCRDGMSAVSYAKRNYKPGVLDLVQRRCGNHV